MKYLVKQILDADVVIGHEIKQQVTAKHLPRGGNYIFVEGVDTAYPKIEIDEDGVMSIVEDTAPKQLKEAWVAMDQAIVDDAVPIFKTTNRESMLVFVDDFQLRIMVPEMFVAAGEAAEVNTTTYGEGEVLDTVEKVKGYYSEVLYDLLQKRRTKIGEYLQFKAGLGL